jgi:hypothetical protein
MIYDDTSDSSPIPKVPASERTTWILYRWGIDHCRLHWFGIGREHFWRKIGAM